MSKGGEASEEAARGEAKLMIIRFIIVSILSLRLLAGQETCKEEFEKNPFPEQIVNQVLNQFDVPPSEWVGINRALQRQLGLLQVKVQQKAAKMERNPFNPPEQTVVIGRLEREALIEGFGYVMRQHGVKKKRQIYDMFDAIQDEKAERLWECLQK